ncbi:MAG TPA: AAA family ATPase [Galbitalea sp.]|nr:AAA family ATPase [Galbitalea sp.]
MMAPIAGPAMIGRESDLQALTAALSDARRGVSRCVVLGGEAGMGKTRLLEEFRATIDSDVVVLRAECVDLGPLGVPFGPVRAIIRQLVSIVGADAVLAAAGAGRSSIVALLPELADRLDESDVGAEPLHETIPSLLGELSETQPIVILLDDAQWADAATLSLFHYLLRIASNERLLVVVAYRSDDTGRTHPLRRILAELDRARAISRRELEPLSTRDLGTLVTSLRGAEPDHDVIEQIARRSQGVPFYVEELAALGGDLIPDTLRDVLLTRYEKLDSETRAFLRVLSVGGLHVDHGVIGRVLGDADVDVLARAAADESVLIASEDGYAFRHALVREAIYAELLPGERQAAHERYAIELEQLGVGAAEVSFHWFAAHDLPRALSTSLIAFDEAMAGRAFASALQLGERALEIWGKVPDAETLAGRSRAALLGQVTTAARDAGDRARGLALVDEALAATEDPWARARLLQVKAALFSEEGLPGAEDAYIEALSIVGDSEDDLALKARLQVALATRYQLTGRMAQSRAQLANALHTARRSGSAEVLSRVLVEMGWDETVSGDPERGRALFAEALENAGDGEGLLLFATNASDAYVLVGDYNAALEVTERPIVRARELGLERSWGGILSNSVDALIGLGRWDEADERGREVLAIRPSGCSVANQHRRRIAIANWKDQTSLASAIARDHGPLIRTFAVRGDLQDFLPTALTLGELAFFEGDLDEAWRQVTLAWDPVHEGATGYDLPILGLAARILGELRRRGGVEPVGAVDRIDEVFSRAAAWPIVPRWRALVDAELSGPDGSGTDVGAWTAAVEALSDGSIPAHLLAYSLWRRGQAELNVGNRAAATESLQSAAETAERIGASWVTNRANELLLTAGLTDRSRKAPEQLTSREEQVLDLVSEGLSNREIGERLFISTKTASVHVSAILRKLGATTRTQAAMHHTAGR